MDTTHSAGFEAVHAVSSLLYGVTVPWWITGGWAIDLAAGHVTRHHSDVNVMMLERDEHALRGLTGVGIQLIADGQPPGPWPAGRRLTAGPTAPAPGPRPGPRPGPKPGSTDAPGPAPGPAPGGPDRLLLSGEDLPLPAEVILASAVGAFWVYKRGARIFTRPLADITRYWQGIPYLAPEVVLLFKARPGTDGPRTDNDQRDFEAVLPVLGAGQRSWLKDAIERQSWLRHALEPQPQRKEAIEPPPRPPRRHRWTAELAADPHRPA